LECEANDRKPICGIILSCATMSPNIEVTVAAARPVAPLRPGYKWELLSLFWCAYFLNQGDRQVFNVVLPLIKADLHATDVQLGLVATGFTLVYGLLVPAAGFLGDRFSRKWIVVGSLLTFSVGTVLTGVGSGLLALLVFRSLATGAGEAFYYPAANALIGEFHRHTRAQAMAVHQSALYVGTIVSSIGAGYIGQRHGWRAAFYTFGVLGIGIAALMALRLRADRPAVGGNPVEIAEPRAGMREVLSVILRKPTLYFLSVAFGAMVFVNVGFLTWMPTFLYEKFQLSLERAAFQSVFLHLVFAFIGVMIGGRISDRLAARRPTIRLEMEWLGLLLGAPFIYLLGRSPALGVVYVALAGFGLFRGIYDSNLIAALFDVIPPRYRSSATGLMLAFAFVVGASAPVILGYIKQHADLGQGLSALAFVYLFGAAVLFAATKLTFPRDYLGAGSTEAAAL
jgi:MFS family permease